ncbi:MAG: HEAT repeat domain-containing protein [Thermodesulfovibrio sp.]|nr:HEAT repeat domain-containing protein [Thermodesulfovibrio sp.]MCX7724837.1 HEAT repeat domain-containing protein [Thermodesulfovibrio sp.]MDW7971630.1 HEAT repeat domain-containing protein [Thermodesulfovibrio sp.]
MIHFFCPSCWREISESVVMCPYCNYDLRDFNCLSYDDKLILSLKHPIKEIRRLIIFLIGLKKLKKALPELEKMIEYEEDPIVLIEIVKTLQQINDKYAKAILNKMRFHRFSIISRYIEQIEYSQIKEFYGKATNFNNK